MSAKKPEKTKKTADSTTQKKTPLAVDDNKKRPYTKPVLEKHGDVHLWAFGTLGG